MYEIAVSERESYTVLCRMCKSSQYNKYPQRTVVLIQMCVIVLHTDRLSLLNFKVLSDIVKIELFTNSKVRPVTTTTLYKIWPKFYKKLQIIDKLSETL